MRGIKFHGGGGQFGDFQTRDGFPEVNLAGNQVLFKGLVKVALERRDRASGLFVVSGGKHNQFEGRAPCYGDVRAVGVVAVTANHAVGG